MTTDESALEKLRCLSAVGAKKLRCLAELKTLYNKMPFCVSLFHRTNFHAMQSLMSMINRFSEHWAYVFIFIPLCVIDADKTLADHVTWSRCSHLYFSNTSMDPHVQTVNRTPAVSGLIAQINPLWGLEVFYYHLWIGVNMVNAEYCKTINYWRRFIWYKIRQN